jgi:hypothetical protein
MATIVCIKNSQAQWDNLTDEDEAEQTNTPSPSITPACTTAHKGDTRARRLPAYEQDLSYQLS